MMKKYLFGLLAVLTISTAKGQDVAEEEQLPQGYKRTAIYSASGAFTELSNWNAGGENSSNLSLLLRENWVKKDANWTTVHLLEGNYGLSRQAGVLTKNADKLEFTTTVTGSPKKTDWNISGQVNARTQFAPGYAAGDTTRTPISTIGAPIYGQFSLGMGNTSNEHWQIFISPLAGKTTTVFDQDLRDKAAFGVDTGATWRFEAGAKLTLNYTEQFTDQFSITAKTDMFYNYATSVNATDIALDIIALYKIKEAFSVNAHLQLNRDIDQIDAWQRRSVLGVGLAYTIK
jgi:hypothetical protein